MIQYIPSSRFIKPSAHYYCGKESVDQFIPSFHSHSFFSPPPLFFSKMTLKSNFKSQGTVLILEKALEASGQPVENLNFLEHFLITTLERVGRKSELFKSKFLLRRLPSYAGAFGNANEYGVVLEAFPFLLNSPMKNWHGSTFDKHGNPSYGQIEIFSTNKSSTKEANGSNLENEREEFINETRAYKSHELFVKFATLFVETANEVKLGEGNEKKESRDEIQPLASHLLFDIKCESDVNKMIILKQNEIPLNKKMKGKVQVKLNQNSCFIQVRIADTKVTLRPTLFHPKGYFKVNSNILERIPLFHNSIINITDALKKGCLLFPTRFETLWTLGFWPSESHLVSLYHPSSIVSRVFKIYTAFCLNPYAVWEALNSSFLIGIPDETLGLGMDMDTLSNNSFSQNSLEFLTFDFLFSSFLFHLEKYEEVTDWSPLNFQKRLLLLLNTSVDAQEKGYHSHYFTRINVLRESLKKEALNRKAPTGSLSEKPETPRAQCEIEEDSGSDGDFGLRFENLAVRGEDELTSEKVYKSLNPFTNFESGVSSRRESNKEKHHQSKPKSLSRIFGTKSKTSRTARSASVLEGREKSMTDIANEFEEVIAELRKEEKMKQFSSSIEYAETSFSAQDNKHKNYQSQFTTSDATRNYTSTRENFNCISNNMENSNFSDMFEPGEKWGENEETIYRNIIQVISESPFPDTFGDPELVHEFDKTIRVLSSQAELISAWTEIMTQEGIGNEKLDFICPHAFNSRQIEYISIVIQKMSQCSPITVRRVGLGGATNENYPKMPSWEMCGDILRTVLHQMRSDVVFNNLNHVERIEPKKKFSFKTRNTTSFNEGSPGPSGHGGSGIKRKLSQGFSFNFRRPTDFCKAHGQGNNSKGFEEDNENFALDDPETAATHRLLQWLWQLKNSGIGRLSKKAEMYIQQLFRTSYVNSHFLEQLTEEKIFHTMAMRSAVAVSQIMSDEKFPAYVPLLAASKKGWVWAEMVLSLANWNGEKGTLVRGLVRGGEAEEIERDLQFPLHFNKEMTRRCVDSLGRRKFTSKRVSSIKWEETEESDTEAITLAFHSETSTPLGWNDFEDPRRPGPFTIPILILSPGNYFNRWEMIPGNIVQVLIRLQKFNALQNIGSMLFVPHRKVALGEIRKLNKSMSFRPNEFDENVMSKTFKRLASLRTTKNFLNTIGYKREERLLNRRCFTCDEVGCEETQSSETTITNFKGKQVECTKL